MERLLREDGWNIGIGIGEVDEPLPESTRAGRGAAYVHARDAVTAAKSSPWHLRVDGRRPRGCALETTLWLWAAVLARRTRRGWEVADLVDTGATYDEVATRLGITQSAVSQRAQAAGIVEGRRARELVTELTAGLLDGWHRREALRERRVHHPARPGLLALRLVAGARRLDPLRPRRSGRRSPWCCSPRPRSSRRWPDDHDRPGRDHDAGRPRRGARGGRRWTGHHPGLRLRGRSETRSPRRSTESLDRAGGAGDGAPRRRLDRRARAAAVFAGLAAGFPEGVAVVLALKGVGRFPDLRHDQGRTGTTERFIIGTFTSVLWAAACAGIVALVLR